MNALQFVLTFFHTKKLCSRLFSSEVRCCTRKSAVLRFRAPFGGLGVTYNDHIGKRVVDFILVLSELISLGVKAEALRANIGSKSKSTVSLQRGPVFTIFQVEGVAPSAILFLSKLSYVVFRMV